MGWRGHPLTPSSSCPPPTTLSPSCGTRAGGVREEEVMKGGKLWRGGRGFVISLIGLQVHRDFVGECGFLVWNCEGYGV